MSPNLILVREKQIDGEPFSGLIFGIFPPGKMVGRCKKAILRQVPCPVMELETVVLRLGYIYGDGIRMLKVETPAALEAEHA